MRYVRSVGAVAQQFKEKPKPKPAYDKNHRKLQPLVNEVLLRHFVQVFLINLYGTKRHTDGAVPL